MDYVIILIIKALTAFARQHICVELNNQANILSDSRCPGTFLKGENHKKLFIKLWLHSE